jgi:hypothetical protein
MKVTILGATGLFGREGLTQVFEAVEWIGTRPL